MQPSLENKVSKVLILQREDLECFSNETTASNLWIYIFQKMYNDLFVKLKYVFLKSRESCIFFVCFFGLSSSTLWNPKISFFLSLILFKARFGMIFQKSTSFIKFICNLETWISSMFLNIPWLWCFSSFPLRI